MATWRQQAKAHGWGPPKAKRERPQVETAQYVEMVRRMIRRLAERVGDDPASLPALNELREAVTDALVVAIAAARAQNPPYSWAEIGEQMGTSRQAAEQFYRRNSASETAVVEPFDSTKAWSYPSMSGTTVHAFMADKP